MPTSAILLGILIAAGAATATAVASELADAAATRSRAGALGSPPAAWKLSTETGALYYCTRAKACALVKEQ